MSLLSPLHNYNFDLYAGPADPGDIINFSLEAPYMYCSKLIHAFRKTIPSLKNG